MHNSEQKMCVCYKWRIALWDMERLHCGICEIGLFNYPTPMHELSIFSDIFRVYFIYSLDITMKSHDHNGVSDHRQHISILTACPG